MIDEGQRRFRLLVIELLQVTADENGEENSRECDEKNAFGIH